MDNDRWAWANLTDGQLQQLAEAEATLGADYLLAYQPGQPAGSRSTDMGLHAAALTSSQLECLQGLESQLQAVVVAYRKGKP